MGEEGSAKVGDEGSARVGDDQGSAKPRKLERWHKLELWQKAGGATIVVALIGGIVSITVALINANSAHTPPTPTVVTPTSEASPTSPTPLTSSKPPTASIAVTSWSQSPSPPPPGESYTFSGIIQNWAAVSDLGAQVFVIARPGGLALPQASSRAWTVSPPALISASGRWIVRWRLDHPPPNAQWTPILVIPPSPEERVYGPTEPPPIQFLTLELASLGPGAPVVAAKGTPVHS